MKSHVYKSSQTTLKLTGNFKKNSERMWLITNLLRIRDWTLSLKFRILKDSASSQVTENLSFEHQMTVSK